MTTLYCELDCSHKIVWGESPETPGASLPHVGMTAWCPGCESDQDIIEVTPARIITDQEQISAPGQPRDFISLFYDASAGVWGYFLHGETSDMLTYESDDVSGFGDAASAFEAARDHVAELQRQSDDVLDALP